jgi:hypothetical protein
MLKRLTAREKFAMLVVTMWQHHNLPQPATGCMALRDGISGDVSLRVSSREKER